MRIHSKRADVLVPDGLDLEAALARTTHLGVGTHQDDLEIMACHGILKCFGREDLWFTGVTSADGSGSARSGVYADYSDEDMTRARMEEQRAAARIGRYGALLQLCYASREVKDPQDRRLEEDLVSILKSARPQVLYTHNPADKHATHVAVAMAVIDALRALPAAERPQEVYGCEVWRDLDWLPDEGKVPLDVSGHENLKAALLGVYDSQIAGGKRYDLATLGRQRANATYLESHGVDTQEAMVTALDLTPLLRDEDLKVEDYIGCFIDEFRASVLKQIGQVRKS